MSTTWHLGPVLDVQCTLSPFTWWHLDLFGEEANPCGNINVLPCLQWREGMGINIVRANREIQRPGHPLHHVIGERLIFPKTPLNLPIAGPQGTKFFNDPRA